MELLLPGFCAALILVGIHAYLGIHVIERGVIFVDLAMAQSAALGTIVGYIIFHHGPDHIVTYLFSLGFTLTLATIFAASRSQHSRIPHEVMIGLTYAILSAVTMLLLDHAPHGAERIREMLTGHVLWVSWPIVLKTAVLYGIIGLVHFIWRRPFILISTDIKEAEKQGISIAFWDFVFYGTFGVIITSSVAIGGVLLVFSLLVAPAMVAFLFAKSFKRRLVIGYVFGFVVTILGFLLSYKLDLPTGATVVAAFGGLLFPLGIYRYIWRSPDGRSQRAAFAFSGIIVFVAVLFIAWKLRPHHVQNEQQATHNHSSTTASKHAHRVIPHTKKHDQAIPTARAKDAHHTRRKQPVSSHPSTFKATYRKLLEQLEGKGGTPLLVRQQAFQKLCKLTQGKLLGCPFSGNLLQLGSWLDARARYARAFLQPTHPKSTSTKRRDSQ